MSTYFPSGDTLADNRKWYVVDAAGQTVGRLATEVARVLTGNFWLLQILGAVMTVYGLYVLYLMLRRPEDLAVEENHVSWAHMYRMMFVAQIGFALASLL